MQNFKLTNGIDDGTVNGSTNAINRFLKIFQLFNLEWHSQ